MLRCEVVIESFNSRLDELLLALNKPNYHTLIFTDCNINLLKLNSSQLTTEYLDTVHSNGFLLTNFKASRVNQDSFTLIDHILSNNTFCDVTSGSFVHDISDHFPIFFSCNEVKCLNKSTVSTSRNFH
jgi:hypothetical protein